MNQQYQLNETIYSQRRRGSIKTQITRCVHECPITTVVSSNNDGFECKFTCPKYHVLFNRTCVDKCPHSHRYLVQHKSNYMHQTIVMCVAECPSGFVLDDQSCEKRCPNDKFVENETCSVRCSNETLICSLYQCYHNYKFGINYCLLECPKDHVIHESTCYRYCYQTPQKYLLHGVCVDVCPSNLYVGLGHDKKCVDNCPENLVVFEGSCRSVCPQNTILVNETCYKTCPNAVPYMDVYIKTVKRYHYRYYYYYREENHTECVRHCPENKFHSHNECVHTCINRLVHNRSCTDNCPESHLHHYTTIGKNETKCVDKRPVGSVLFNGTYFDRCPDQANYEHNGTCFNSCPSVQQFYEFYNKGVVSCLTKCPTTTLVLNSTCVLQCPEHYWAVNRSYCDVKCPTSFPLQFTERLYNKENHICVDKCPFGHLVLNGSCVSYCPKYYLFDNGSCVDTCPVNYNFIMNISRLDQFKTFPYPFFRRNALLCIPECFDLNPQHPCLSFTGEMTFLLNGSCHVLIENVQNGKDNTAKSEKGCVVFRMYNVSGLFELSCPNDKFHDGQICVQSCPTERPLFKPSNRICVDRCPSPLLAYKNNCLSSCPDKTFVYESQCVTNCPDDMQYRLKASGGMNCLHECPHKYYIDGNMCIDKCSKKISGRNCVPKCPSTHPFEDYDYEGLTKIYSCYDYCPDSKLGNTTTFKCMYSYGCEGYRYDKKCYKKCPPGTFIFTHGISSLNNCADISAQKIAIGISIFILVAMIAFICWCCTEKNVFSGSPQTSQTEVNIHLSFVSMKYLLNSSFHNLNERWCNRCKTDKSSQSL